jgi:hypothetical protein
VCQICKKQIKKDQPYEIDHCIRREAGGSDEDSNLQPLHKHCHDAKTTMECNVFKLDRTLSHYNAATLEIFGQAKNAIVHNFVHWSRYGEIIIDKNEETGKITKSFKLNEGVIMAGLDLVKCRTNILLHGIKDPFADFSALNDPEEFDPTDKKHSCIPPGEYYIHTKTILPAKGNEWCSHVKVKHMLAAKLLKLGQIKWIVVANLTHPGDYYAPFVQAVLDKLIISEPGCKSWKQEVHIAKNCINQWVGTLAIRTSDFKHVTLYSSLESAATDSYKRRIGECSKELPARKTNDRLKAGESTNVFTKVFDRNDESNHDKDGCLNRFDYIETVTTSSKVRNESHVPNNHTILDAEACATYDTAALLRKFGGEVAHVNTDNAIAIFKNQKQVDEMWAYAQTVFWDEAKTAPKYKRGDVPSINVIERMEVASKTAYNYQKPVYTVTKDPGHNGVETTTAVAKQIVDDLVNPEIETD